MNLFPVIVLALSGAIEVCEIDGVPTYTDRNDVCEDGQPVILDQGTFSLVDGRPIDEATDPVEPPLPSPLIIERIIERPVPVVIQVGAPIDQRPQHYWPWVIPAHRPRAQRGQGVLWRGVDDEIIDSPPPVRRKPARNASRVSRR